MFRFGKQEANIVIVLVSLMLLGYSYIASKNNQITELKTKVEALEVEKNTTVTKLKATYAELISTQAQLTNIKNSVKIKNGEATNYGKPFRITAEVTAYLANDPQNTVNEAGQGITFTGNICVPFKTVAVDPKVIPLYSKVYIPGVGWCIAHDTGSSVKNNVVDLAVHSEEYAVQWGRRNLDIYVVPPLKG